MKIVALLPVDTSHLTEADLAQFVLREATSVHTLTECARCAGPSWIAPLQAVLRDSDGFEGLCYYCVLPLLRAAIRAARAAEGD